MESETEFLLRRASEESRKAMNSVQPQAEAAHDEMAMRYSVKAIIALSDVDEIEPPVGRSETQPI
ncbi:MAG: hypothetical protein ABIO43_10715 [Sphingomicrobium sp.]